MCCFVMRARGESPDAASFRFERFRGPSSDGWDSDGWFHCDCGTILGNNSLSGSRVQAHVRALRKKGWSDAKIKRAQQDQETHNPGSQRRDRELAFWMKAIPEAVHKDGWLGLLLIWGRTCEFSSRENVPLKELSPELLYSMKKRVLYNFVP